MKRWYLMSLSLCALGCGVTLAQPPMSREGGPPPHNPIMDALDPDHDHVISAEEIKVAVAALLKLDKNEDGQLTEDEFRPERPGGPEGPQGGPPPQDGLQRDDRNGPPPRDGFGPPQGFGPPGLQRGPGEGPEQRRPEEDRPEEDRPEQRRPDQDRPGQRGPGMGGPGMRGPGMDGPGMGPGPEQGPGPGGPPDPERFVEHAMEFDSDKDGLLSREELLKFAHEGMRRGGPVGPGGPSEGRRPGGRGPGDGPREQGDQPRPQRPQRPE